MIKLFHWKTHSYSTHKATDELYSKLNDDIDKFVVGNVYSIYNSRTIILENELFILIDD